ncbi:hypothetical protein [Rhizobium mesoamericanum]|uniref:Uncharacterized protein n=1 Tax=Rhizobium mesoamericanum STM3625 TaxID=1211777 RepID=K0PIK1_9HYPH|nr:hypothetical protein [Rhizobium mesoamericanum]CCM76341.1 hypothetical protein BN77_0134 [Rhizobium mesoamericanum STM3625]
MSTSAFACLHRLASVNETPDITSTNFFYSGLVLFAPYRQVLAALVDLQAATIPRAGASFSANAAAALVARGANILME